ncbi:unnamed protein product [Peronospora belbahrii]|uniref:Uncharacterized protein n=1 Tax=Peronospora belbahrii TaxID=622444 RepID=A0ABN8D2J5_9STRA|nr:unnamed protein product [Peronospora belbahrii]
MSTIVTCKKAYRFGYGYHAMNMHTYVLTADANEDPTEMGTRVRVEIGLGFRQNLYFNFGRRRQHLRPPKCLQKIRLVYLHDRGLVLGALQQAAAQCCGIDKSIHRNRITQDTMGG